MAVVQNEVKERHDPNPSTPEDTSCQNEIQGILEMVGVRPVWSKETANLVYRIDRNKYCEREKEELRRKVEQE